MAKQPRPLMGMRPSPYNRNERMMGGGGMGGNMGMGSGMGYGRGRGGRNLKGNLYWNHKLILEKKIFTTALSGNNIMLLLMFFVQESIYYQCD